jgi:hypothetical protein
MSQMPIYGRGIIFQVRTAIYLTLLDMLTEQIHFFDTKVQLFFEMHAKNVKIHATTTNRHPAHPFLPPVAALIECLPGSF